MPSLLLVVFLLQVVIHVINSFGATLVNELVRALCCAYYQTGLIPVYSYGAYTTSSRYRRLLPVKNHLYSRATRCA